MRPRLAPGPLRDLTAALDQARRDARLTYAQLGARAGVAERTAARACTTGQVRLTCWIQLWTVLYPEVSRGQSRITTS